MLQAIGGLVVFGLILLGGIRLTEYLNERGRKREQAIDHSLKAYSLRRMYTKSVRGGNPIMTEREYKKNIRKLLAEEKGEIEKSIRESEEMELESKKRKERSIKLGYKYRDMIFSAFYDNIELDKPTLLSQIPSNQMESQEEIFNIWLENQLISTCPWNKNMYKIGMVLELENLKLVQDDPTRKEWLELHNITLNPKSYEHEQWLNSVDEI